jgi:hypothetical protein
VQQQEGRFLHSMPLQHLELALLCHKSHDIHTATLQSRNSTATRYYTSYMLPLYSQTCISS